MQLMLPLQEGTFLLGNRYQGLFYFDGKQVTPVNTQASTYLKEKQLYYGIQLQDGHIALATLIGGVIIIDQKAALKQVLNKETGLTSNAAYGLGTDKNGGLWIAMDKGVGRVALQSPFTYFDERNGLQGSIQATLWHKGHFYVGTHTGLFVLEPGSTYQASTFRKLTETIHIIYTLFSFGESLLIGGDEGIYELKNGQIIQISSVPCVDIQPSRRDPNLFFIASDGLFAIRKTATGWKDEGMIPGVRENMHAVVETPTGELWLPTRWQGVLHVRFPSASQHDFFRYPLVDRYGAKQGLPPGNNHIYLLDKQTILRIGDDNFKLFGFNGKNTFEPLPDFNKQFGLGDKKAYPAFMISQSDSIWLWTKNPGEQHRYWTLATKQSGNRYALQHFHFNQLTDYTERLSYLAGNGIMWFGGSEKIARFNWHAPVQIAQPFPTLLARIAISSGQAIYPDNISYQASLPFEHNSLRFEFAAPIYNREEENKFQFKLEGYDEDWSAWIKESFKEYTRIPEGNYTFHVRSMSSVGDLGQEAKYTFTILPPWYRTWPMYLLYALLAGSLVFGMIRWRSAKLLTDKIALEKIVAQRTHEVATKNEQLARQAEKMAIQTEKLKEIDQVKSRFFANISHEFRTPLTLILNNLVDKMSTMNLSPEKNQVSVGQAELQVMYRNSKRLLELINQLLDLSKIESGKMKVELHNGDLAQFLQVTFASFSSLASFRHIRFQLDLPEEALLCWFDRDKMEKILYNLLSNAFKFTPDSGEITIKTTLIPSGKEAVSQRLQICVQDNGPGITPDQLQRVFDRFYQGKQYYSDEQGTGIGLALVKELVELHEGQIWVESDPGKGACFMVQIPFLPVMEDMVSVEPAYDTLLLATNKESEGFADGEFLVPAETENIPQVMDSEELPLVLVVEDNQDLRQYMRTKLEIKYRIIESGNGRKGVEKAIERVPDLIISDLMMPDMDGLELCRRVKNDERTCHIPVILLTALATTEGKITGLETGADDYLTKPFDIQELDIRIHNLIANRRKLREYFSREQRVQPTHIQVVSADDKFLQKAILIVEANMDDYKFSVEEFSREAGMSRMQLHRKLTALTGQSASDFIRIIRLKRAAQLLEARAGNVSEISYQVGFNTLSYFSKCFHDYFGVMPTEYVARQTINQS